MSVATCLFVFWQTGELPRHRGLPARESKLIESPEGMAQIAKEQQVDDWHSLLSPLLCIQRMIGVISALWNWLERLWTQVTAPPYQGYIRELTSVRKHVDPRLNEIFTRLEFATDVVKNTLTMYVHPGVNTALEDWMTSVFGQWKGVFMSAMFSLLVFLGLLLIGCCLIPLVRQVLGNLVSRVMASGSAGSAGPEHMMPLREAAWRRSDTISG